MNPWSKAECQKLADALHLEDQDEWLLRFNLVGGKAKTPTFGYLFKRVHDDIPHTTDDLKDQVLLFTRNVFDDRMRHTVFHLRRDEQDPTCSYLTYASLVVVAIASCRYNIQSADEIRTIIEFAVVARPRTRKVSAARPCHQKVLYEVTRRERCRAVTQHGPFDAKSEIIHVLPKINAELMLYIPLSKTFAAIDGVLVVPQERCIIYAQSAVSTAHPLSTSIWKKSINI
ncbi:hypothetical protein GQ600_7515 [Phytophthora cactorum]|nr:hypothetical protein GQ600_7515 [Phytophthora cactorum]